MKKILKLSMVFLIICMIMMGKVYAMECSVSIESQKTEFEVNEEFKVDFCISDIKSDRGVISLQATLEYDKDSLTLIKMEGKNGWETPAEGASYNEKNGKIAIVRSGTSKSNEVILSITFKVKENAKQNPSINLKDISIADGDGMAKFAKISKNVTVKSSNIATDTPSTEKPTTETPSTEKPATDTPSTERPTTETPSTEKPIINITSNHGTDSDKTVSDEKLPQTGSKINFAVIVFFIVAISIGIYSFIKIKEK